MDIIHSYTRAQAITDGVLVDITETASEAGFKYPVAMTSAAHADAVAWDQAGHVQDEQGRLWDVLMMARLAALSGTQGDRSTFQVLRIPNEPKAQTAHLTTLHMTIGPGDTSAPVITITTPDED
jgi:hypothetical protein